MSKNLPLNGVQIPVPAETGVMFVLPLHQVLSVIPISYMSTQLSNLFLMRNADCFKISSFYLHLPTGILYLLL
jgi:hypothetical protein